MFKQQYNGMKEKNDHDNENGKGRRIIQRISKPRIT